LECSLDKILSCIEEKRRGVSKHLIGRRKGHSDGKGGTFYQVNKSLTEGGKRLFYGKKNCPSVEVGKTFGGRTAPSRRGKKGSWLTREPCEKLLFGKIPRRGSHWKGGVLSDLPATGTDGWGEGTSNRVEVVERVASKVFLYREERLKRNPYWFGKMFPGAEERRANISGPQGTNVWEGEGPRQIMEKKKRTFPS